MKAGSLDSELKYLVEKSEPRPHRAQIKSENLAYRTWLEIYRENGQKQGTPARLEAQRVGGDHASLLHHGCGDGPQVLEELPGLTGAQSLDVSHDPVVGLRSERERFDRG